MSVAEIAVKRSVEFMFFHYSESLTIDDIARSANFSKFHFTRIFRKVAGMTPGRFLAAIRIHEAKRLLLTTSLSVVDISNVVGYSSVGSFSTKFHNAVGMSPSEYRACGGPAEATCDPGEGVPDTPTGSLAGRVDAENGDELGLVFVGVFPTRIPRGRPVRGTVLPSPGAFVIDNVPAGKWYVLSHSLSAGWKEVLRVPVDGDMGLYVGSYGPTLLDPGATANVSDLVLRPGRNVDPPVLLALLDIRAVQREQHAAARV